MKHFWNKISEFGLKPGMSIQTQKSIMLLNRISVLLILFFSLVVVLTYKNLPSPIISYMFIANIVMMLCTFLITKYLNATISKFIISVFIPIVIVIMGAYGKSIGVTNTAILYLAPRMILTIAILIPTLLFGYRELKNAIIAIIPGLLIFLLYDIIHGWFGVYLKDMPFELQYYGVFVAMITLYLVFVLSSILFLQNVNFKNELKLQNNNKALAASEEELKQQNEEILTTNNHLVEYQEVILEQQVEMEKLLTAVEQSDSGIIITSSTGIIEYANPFFTKLTGYTQEEIIGKKTPSILKSGYHDANFYKIFWNTIRSGKVWSGIFRNKRKNGELYWEQTTISPVKNPEGKTTNFVAIKEDISRRKENERALLDAFKTIQEKNEHIHHSINYAKRIQTAILPTCGILENNFADFFIFNKAVDVVSGDFYYFHETETEIIIAVADCTGHGIPGGFMTMLGHAFLDNIINTATVDTTGEILDRLRSVIIKSLNQTNSFDSSKDGMDISICKIDKNTLQMQYSGAYNPILLIKGDESELIKADRMPIGIYPKMKDFQTHEIEIEEGDLIYLFSDGFQDQFGGENNQKYKSRNFYNLLIANKDKNLKEQKEIIEGELDDWIWSNNRQMDDILILGIKI